jgi:beta-galactosidase
VAIVLDWDSWWAVEGEAQPTEISYAENLTAWYAAVHRLNVAIDFVPADGDLSAYAVVIAPHLFVLDAGPAERMDRFVRDGGVLVGTYLTGIVDSSVQAHLGGYPGPLASTFGVRVEEFAPTAATLTLDSSLPIRMPDATQWAEYLTLDNASAVASFTHDDLQGSPAITRHEHGNGTAWYVGTRLAQEALDQLVRTVLEEAGIDLPFADLPEGIEVVVRGDRLFLLNHTGASYTLAEVTGVPPVAVDAGDCVVLTMNLSEIEALA